MSSLFRMLIGIGLFTFGFQLGRAVGRMEPLAGELKGTGGRRGVVIDGEKVEGKQRAENS